MYTVKQPTRAQVRKLIETHLGWTHEQTADFLDVSISTVDKWCMPSERTGRNIPMPAYHLLLMKAGRHPRWRMADK